MKVLAPLTTGETELLRTCEKGDTDRIRQIVNEGNSRVDCLDENGMTPLQHASFKGNIEVCSFLLSKGADVNNNEQCNGYTALMFASLAGYPELCRLLLMAGAKPHQTNNMGKSASKMSAFVGHYQCASVINNFLSLEDVQKIIHPQGTDSLERLPMKYAEGIHRLITTNNVHPIKTIKFMQSNIVLLEQHRKQLLLIMEELFDLQMKQKETDEVMALKIWILVFVIKETLRFVNNQRKVGMNKTTGRLLVLYCKFLLTTESDRNFTPSLDLLVRRAVGAFPYKQCLLFITLTRTLGSDIVTPGQLSLHFVHQALLGQRMVIDSVFCQTCGDSNAKKRCGACKSVHRHYFECF